MAINLGLIAAGNNVFANANGSAIQVYAADPQGGYGCDSNCSLPVTPGATPIKPSLNATTCKAIFTIGQTGDTGVTGGSIIVGLNQWGSIPAVLYGEEICHEDSDFTLFPIVTAEAGAAVEGGAFTGENHLAKFNMISSSQPWIGGNIIAKITGISEAAVNAQLGEPIVVVSMDMNNNLSVCTVELTPNDCSICVNPNSSTANIATFSPNCPLFVDATHGFIYRMLPGTDSVKLTVCILASDVVNNYTACGA